MIFTIIRDFFSLPFTELSEKTNSTSKQSLFGRIVLDILDDEIWGSKVSFIGNALIICAILVSTLDYILSSGGNSYIDTHVLLKWGLAFFFLIEFSLRLFYAKSLGYVKNAQISYLLSFVGIIDLLSLTPILLDIFGIPFISSLSALRILRLWRIARYIPSFNVISNAFNARKEDIITSLLGVLLLSLTLSALIFHFENAYTESSFKNILEVFIWSIGKYTGDYGAIAVKNPISEMGKVIATVNGLLGIALFALPAGLLASAFIEQLEEKRKMQAINERIKKIEKHFAKLTGGGKQFKYKTHPRYASTDYIQSKFLLSESELFECIREAQCLRFRALKSSPERSVSDIRIIESFKSNCAYGYRQFNDESNIVLINAIGHNERGISHFSYTLANGLNLNFIAREFELLNKSGASIGGNSSKEYERFLANDITTFNPTLLEFLQDIDSFNENTFFIILSSAASGRKDIILEYGNDINTVGWDPEKTTLSSETLLNKVINQVTEGLSKVQYTGSNQIKVTQDFSLDQNTIGLNMDNSLQRLIHKKTQANVITLYVNIRILTGEDNLYYSAATAVGNIIEQIKTLD
jgi:voltage-gated potassium channel